MKIQAGTSTTDQNRYVIEKIPEIKKLKNEGVLSINYQKISSISYLIPMRIIISLTELLSFPGKRKLISCNLPYSFFFETRTRCNNICPFCPASIQNDTRNDLYMAEKTFKKCIDELSTLDYHGTIWLHNYNEPLLDKRIVSFIRYASKQLPKAKLSLMTNGILLSPRYGIRLLEAGLDDLVIDNYSDNGILIKNVKNFLIKVASDKSYYQHKFFFLEMRILNAKGDSRAGNSPNRKYNLQPLKLICDWPFRSFVVTNNGDVGLCCKDFKFECVMGNVNRQSIVEIWNGDKFKHARKELFKGNRTWNPLCSKCDGWMGWDGVYNGTLGLAFLFEHLIGTITRWEI